MATPPSSPFRALDLNLYVSILPSALAEPQKNVNGSLNKMLMRYDDDLGGVPLAWTKVSIPSESGQINGDEPQVHIRVTATAHLFAPRNGMELVATVSKISATHISALAYGVFNATISRESLKGYKYESEQWVSSSRSISNGDVIKFRLDRMQHAEGILSMDGSLVSGDVPVIAEVEKTKKREAIKPASRSIDSSVRSSSSIEHSGDAKKSKKNGKA